MAAGLSIAKPEIKLDITPPVVPRHAIAGAIKHAAAATGTSFGYLLATAKIESGFDPAARAATSSARGLFQFIEQTWLGTVKEAGQALGYGHYAEAISRLPSGAYAVADPALRADILKIRHDPAVSAVMAGVLTRSNGIKLGRAIGRTPMDAELYIAHFMGIGAASQLITNAVSNPRVSGASLFPAAAAANRSIFFHRDGTARDVAGVYQVLTRRYANAASAPATREMMAASGVMPVAAARTQLAVAPLAERPVGHTPPPQQGMMHALAFATDTVPATSSIGEISAPIFRSLFQAGPRLDAVSPVIRKLWDHSNGTTGSSEPPRPSPSLAPSSAHVTSFDERWQSVPAKTLNGLFSDRDGRFSS